MSSKIIFNNRLIDRAELKLDISNRAFRFGDGVFETISVRFNAPYLLPYHIARLNHACEMLKIKHKLSEKKLEEAVYNLLKNNRAQEGLIRIIVYREGESAGYRPEKIKESSYIIELVPLPKKKEAIDLGVSDTIKPIHPFFSVKTANSIFYTQAAIEAAEQKLDDVILCNEKANIVETSSANIFLIHGDKIFTPPLTSGCVRGVVRERLIAILKTNSYNIIEKDLDIIALFSSDNIFITNSSILIQPVASITYDKKKKEFKTSSNLLNNIKQLIGIDTSYYSFKHSG